MILIYDRVSTTQQDTLKDKVELERLAKDLSSEAFIYHSETESATKTTWKERDPVKLLDLHHPKTLLARDISRLCREGAEAACRMMLHFKDLGLEKIHFLRGTHRELNLKDLDIVSLILLITQAYAAQQESELRKKNSMAGQRKAKEMGVKFGRPKGVFKLDAVASEVFSMLGEGKKKKEIAKAFGVGEVTLWQWLKRVNYEKRFEGKSS